MLLLATASVITPVSDATSDSDYVKFLDSLKADRAWSIVNDLASDRFEGRRSGTRGANLASEEIAAYFNSIGLKPAGEKGSYRASFQVPLCQFKRTPTLALIDTQGSTLRTFVYKKDFYMRQCSGGGNYSAEVVFAGYAISAKEVGYDDYAGISLKGKIVLAMVGTPPNEKLEKGDYGNVYWKADNAKRRGAVGLIVVDSPANPTTNYIELWSGGWYVYKGFTLLRGSIGMADALLKDKGKTLASIQEAIDQSLKPQSVALGKRLKISAEVTFVQNAKGYNVLGFIPGSDPSASKKRAVLIGAHYDHGGIDADGSILRGANDDASGVAVMMEIARVFSTAVKPKWSMLFAAWSGEEEGLIGSSAYVKRPYIPLTGTIAYLNLDMVGAGEKLECEISKAHKALFAIMDESRRQLNVSCELQDVRGGSDHASFQAKSVPNMMLIYWPDDVYHTSRDTASHVSKQKLLVVAKLTALMALKLSEATVNIATVITNATTVTVICSCTAFISDQLRHRMILQGTRTTCTVH